MGTSTVEISDLPDEVLHQVFSNLTLKTTLSVVIEVCERWRSIVEDDMLLWNNLQAVIDCDKFFTSSHINVEDTNDLIDSKQRNQIFVGEHDLNKIKKVKRLKLVNGNKISNCPALALIRIIDIFNKTCKEIEKVECSQCFGATSSLFLNYLNKCYSNINEIRFGINCVWNIPYNELTAYKNLSTVISYDYRFKRSDLFCLAKSSCQITSLWIILSRALKSNDIVYFLQQKGTTMTELGLGCSVSDDVLMQLKGCSNLKVLFLGDSRFISNIGIDSLKTMPHLKYLSLHRATFHHNSLEAWLSSSDIISQLIVLDLTDYKYKDSPTFQQTIKTIFQGCPVTFSNEISKAVLHSNELQNRQDIHWFYCNVLKELK